MKAPNKIAHIGIAVNSIAETLPFYTEQLGLPLLGTEEVPSEQVRVAFLQIGESRIELLEPLSEESPIAAFLRKRGEGIHHIALDVDDVRERLRRLKENGVPPDSRNAEGRRPQRPNRLSAPESSQGRAV